MTDKEMTVQQIVEMCKDIAPSFTNQEELMDEVDLNSWDYEQADNKILYAKQFDTWVCWDTPVGKSMIFYRDKPVAITVKPDRKSDTEYFWLSPQLAEEVKEYLQSLIEPKKDNRTYIHMNTSVPIEGDDIGTKRSAHYRKF